MSKRASPDISKFAIVGTVIWVTGCKPAYILAFDAEYCLVRIRHKNGAWSKPRWIEAVDGPIVGGLPPAAQAEYIKAARNLPEEKCPRRPPSKYDRNHVVAAPYRPRDTRQSDLFL